MIKPDKLGFMDEDMKNLWFKLQPEDFREYRLYGGTALAMYLNHRKSTDFDFFTQSNVYAQDILNFSWDKKIQTRGTERMVDVVYPGENRNVTINFINIEHFAGIAPAYPPMRASNDLLVAHPADILCNKLAALSNRKAERDFFDIAAAGIQVPDILENAIKLYLENKRTMELTRLDLAKTLSKYSFEVEYGLPETHIRKIKDIIRKLSEAATAGTPDKKKQD